MKNSRLVLAEIIGQIKLNEPADEIRAIALRLIENIAGMSTTEVLADKPIAEEHITSLSQAVTRINQDEPVQYVLREGFFFGRRFYIDRAVLIPRPETEELVSHVLSRTRDMQAPRVLDVATGSGCIAITLDLELQHATVFGTDVSQTALSVACRNADALGSHAQFIRQDFLSNDPPVQEVEILVSNPPYIGESERGTMAVNVTAYEPAMALFVPDDNVLVFYEHLAAKGRQILTRDGLIAVEINERYGREVVGLFLNEGYQDVELLRDIGGKDRFVLARRGDKIYLR